MMINEVLLFGVRSALVVEYEETLHRLGISVQAGISLRPGARLIDLSKEVALDAFDPATSCKQFYACAFFPGTRQRYFDQAEALGLIAAQPLIDPHAAVARTARIGEGSFVNAGAIIGAVSMIGAGTLVNRAASIGHHSMIGDFVSIGPGATLASNIRVGDGAVIGAGATVLPNVRIGANAIVAAGALVRGHVPDDTFVTGVPARRKPFDVHKSSLFAEDGE